MNSTFANILLAIQQLLKEQAPYIKHTDQDLGQLKNPRPAVAWPCVLIDYEHFTYETLGENVQQACGTVVCRLAFAAHSATTSTSPATYKEAALGYYETEHALHRLLQGWQPLPHTGKLNRISAETQKRTDGYRVREMRYSLSFDDYSTKLTTGRSPVVLEVEEELAINAS